MESMEVVTTEPEMAVAEVAPGLVLVVGQAEVAVVEAGAEEAGAEEAAGAEEVEVEEAAGVEVAGAVEERTFRRQAVLE